MWMDIRRSPNTDVLVLCVVFISARGAKHRLNALHENGVLFRDDFESSRAFNSALWYAEDSSNFSLCIVITL